MSKKGTFIQFLTAGLIIGCWHLLRLLPHGALKIPAWGLALPAYCWPGLRKLVKSNIRAAMPELSENEVSRIAKKSFFHLFFNLGEFFWYCGRVEKIAPFHVIPPTFAEYAEESNREHALMLFVNPHLGSWESSAALLPQPFGKKLAVIAKPLRNPYLNRLVNDRERQHAGLKVILSRGAIQATIKAMHNGYCIGMLVDQNTRVRDGGIFLNFFGLPVAGSPAPAFLKHYADSKNMPAVLYFVATIREKDGKLHSIIEKLPKPFAEYRDDREVMQEFMYISEKYIRQYPEQYLWLYKRFQHIPPDCPEDLRRRYPDYAAVPPEKFFRKNGSGQ